MNDTALTGDCPCTRDCPRHGNCAACVANHRFRVPGVPACFFSEEGEKWHDRSFEALFRDKGLLPGESKKTLKMREEGTEPCRQA